jgi:hypothetical protein
VIGREEGVEVIEEFLLEIVRVMTVLDLMLRAAGERYAVFTPEVAFLTEITEATREISS